MLFQQQARHEGCEVASGQKFAFRSDVIWEADEDIRLLYD
jgi:hypothetical protein